MRNMTNAYQILVGRPDGKETNRETQGQMGGY